MSKKNIFYLANSYVLILLLGIINVISAQSLPAPILIEPVDWANIDSLAPTFRWEPVAGALTYQIQISTDKSFQQNIIDTDTITYTQFTSSPLDTGVTYFWQVRAKNLSDTSPWSSVFRLRINGINLTDRLVAYYPFNGNPEDSVGNSDGTLQGDVALAPDRYGKADHAYSFDGNDDYIILPESEAFKSIDREITVSAWINPNSLDFESGLIHRDRFWRLFFYSDGSVVGNIFNENGSENRTGSSTKAPLNQWSHVAFTYDRQHIHVYLNGEHCGQLEFPVARIGQQNISSIPVIGKGFGLSQNYFNGIIDDIRIYDRALTDAEMAELYRDKEPPETPQLTYPENGAINDISLYQSLNWDPIWNAANYHVQLSTVQDFSSLFYDDSTLKNNSVVVGPLTPDQMYYWRVRAQNSNGISAWSDVRYFSVSEGAETVYFYDADANEITLGNNYYELTLLKSTAAIVNIIDKTVDRIISVGIREEHLWRAELFDGNWSGIFVDSPDDTVSYEWDAVNKILIFNYLPNLSVNRNISAQVFFKLSDDYTRFGLEFQYYYF